MRIFLDFPSMRPFIARPAVPESRLKLMNNGDMVLKLKKSYTDGTPHLLFSPLEFIEKLAALVPPPRAHLTRYHGLPALNAKIRSQIIPNPEAKVEGTGGESSKKPRSKKMSFSTLLKRVFKVKRILKHLGPSLGI